EATPEGRSARADPGQWEVEEDPGLPGEAVADPEARQQIEREPQRQTHHAEEVAPDAFHERRPIPLDRVGARLVQRLSCGHVVGDLHVGTAPDGHVVDVRAERQPQQLEQLAAALGAAGEDKNPAREGGGHRSRISVTGPSFTSSTSIMAPNSPVSTRVPLPAPRSLSSATNRSYR